jgi:hypothetical protein
MQDTFGALSKFEFILPRPNFFVPARLGDIVGYGIGTSVRMPPAFQFLHRFTGASNISLAMQIINISLAMQRSMNDCVSIAQQIRLSVRERGGADSSNSGGKSFSARFFAATMQNFICRFFTN